jgi:hypothetical protein
VGPDDYREQRDRAGRYTTRYRDDQLIPAIRSVQNRVCPKAPETLTKRQFNQERAAAGHPACPAARRISQRLNMPWTRLVTLAASGQHAAQQVGLAATDHPGAVKTYPWPRVQYALRLCASRIGQTSLSQRQYRDECAKLEARHQRRRRRGRAPLRLPTVSHVEQYGGWNTAVKRAGLDPAPADSRRFSQRVVIDHAVDAYIAERKTRPTLKQLRQYAGERCWSLAEAEKRRYSLVVKEAVERAAAGHRPAVPSAGEAVRPERAKGSRRQAILGLVALLDWVDQEHPGRSASKRLYVTFQQQHPEWPSESRLREHGSFTALRDLAERARHDPSLIPPEPANQVAALLDAAHTDQVAAILQHGLAHDTFTSTDLMQALDAGRLSVNEQLRRLRAAGGIEQVGREPRPTRGRWLARYRLTRLGRTEAQRL